MREVKQLAESMRGVIAGLRKQHVDAANRLTSEVKRSQDNLSKVNSFTQELSDANKDVEAMLGETGSNFPTSEVGSQQSSGHADRNGVTLNTGG